MFFYASKILWLLIAPLNALWLLLAAGFLSQKYSQRTGGGPSNQFHGAFSIFWLFSGRVKPDGLA